MKNRSASWPLLVSFVCLLALVVAVIWFRSGDASAPKQAGSTEHGKAASPVMPALRATSSAPVPQTARVFEQKEFRAWLAKLPQAQAMPQAERTTFVIEGARLAKERSARMARLIREDPKQALSEAVSLDEYALLPQEVKPLVERPFSERASYQWLPVCVPPGTKAPAGTPDHIATLHMPDGSELNAFTYGQRDGMTTKRAIPVQGIALGADAAVHDSVLRPLRATEIATAQALFAPAKPLSQSFLTGKPITGGATLALAGGKLFAFASPAELQEVDHALAKLDALPGPDAGSQVLYLPSPADGSSNGGGFSLSFATQSAIGISSVWTESKKKVFLIRADFSDNTGEPFTQAATSTVMNGAVSNQILAMSYGKTWIEATVSANVYRVPSTTTYYVNGGSGLNSELLRDARNTFRTTKSGADAAINIGPVYNSGSGDNGLGDYDIVGVVFKSIGMISGGVNYAGLAGGGNIWMQGSISDSVFIHEFGHNYGLGHSSFWQTSDGSVVGAGSSVEYGDDYDIMGGGDPPEGHFHAQGKALLNWLTASQWSDATASGNATYRIYRIDSSTTTGTPRGVRVTKSATPGSEEYYWLTYRKAYGANAHFDSGVNLVWQRPGQSRSWLVDVTPSTSGDKTDSPLDIGRTYSDTTAQVHLTPVAKGGSGSESYIDVQVNSGAFPGNAAPTAGAITGGATVAARTAQTYSISASDSNGDTLAYWWSAGDGTVSDNAASITHSFPVGGTYTLTCVVSDMKGGTQTVTKTVTVTDPIDTWTAGGVSTTADPYDLIAAKGRFVAACYFGEVLFSWDGATFTNLGGVTGLTRPHLAYGNDTFVAAGGDGTNVRICWSRDGRRWFVASPPVVAGEVEGITFGNGKFVAVANHGDVFVSTDGVTWTSNHVSGATELDYVVWDGGMFVVAGIQTSGTQIRTLWTSATGTSWTMNPVTRGESIQALFANGSRLFYTGWYAGVYYSTDHGANWTEAPMPQGNSWSTWQMVQADDGTLLTLARDMDAAVTTYGLLISQDNGTSWQKSLGISAGSISQNGHNLAYAQGRFFVVQDNGVVQRTDSFFPGNTAPVPSFVSAPTTGSARASISFSSSASDSDGGALTYAWDFGSNVNIADGASASLTFDFGGSYPYTLHVSDGRGGHSTLAQTIVVSDPARTFTARTSGTTKTLYTIVNSNSIAVAGGGSGGVIRSSPDGVTWTTRTVSSATNVYFYGGAWTGSKFILVGQDYNFGISDWVSAIATSSDGITWSRPYTGTTIDTDLSDVASSGSVHVAVGTNGTILRSTDAAAATWTTVSVPALVGKTLSGISYGAGTFVLVGYVGGNGTCVVYTSPDGSTWTDRSSGSGVASWQDLRKVKYLNNRFVSSGWYSKQRVSTDGGLTFTSTRTDSEELPGNSYGNGVWFSAGVNHSASDADTDLLSLDGVNWNAYTAPTTNDRKAATFFQNTFITVGVNGEIWQSDAVTLTPIQSWRLANLGTLSGSGTTADSADYDSDGLVNLLEFAFGTNPATNDLRGLSYVSNTITTGQPVCAQSGGTSYALFVRRKDYLTAGLTYTVQSSTDLSTWTTINLTPTVLADDGTNQVVSVPMPAASHEFFHVIVTGP
ncbi:MAG: PKD domain-containing protein [Verrucomicrobiaceae bacterium]|nr:PKD domain-containing protein [Verrucomicrobiaceae bacterium]